jgi:hypothetical protein
VCSIACGEIEYSWPSDSILLHLCNCLQSNSSLPNNNRYPCARYQIRKLPTRHDPLLFLMTSSTLRNSRVSENQITHKSAHSNSQHDPSIISHEQQPIFVSLSSLLETQKQNPLFPMKLGVWKGERQTYIMKNE